MIEARFAARRPALEAAVRAANLELARAIEQSDGDSPQVQAAVDHFHMAMGILQKETLGPRPLKCGPSSHPSRPICSTRVSSPPSRPAKTSVGVDTASDLPARAAVGDRAAFSALMRETKGPLFRFVRRYVGDEQEAHDLLQDTYAAAWVRIRRYDPGRPFEAWIRTIALNKCRDWSRRRFVRRLIRGGVDLSSPEAMAVPDGSEPADERMEAGARLARLNAELDRLPSQLKGASVSHGDRRPQSGRGGGNSRHLGQGRRNQARSGPP